VKEQHECVREHERNHAHRGYKLEKCDGARASMRAEARA
jgi:hypothetical protein